MIFSKITPLILTFNEAPNLWRTLERLAWAKGIVIVDSFSTDAKLGNEPVFIGSHGKETIRNLSRNTQMK